MSEETAQSPAAHLHALLARAQNPFDVPDAVLDRLEDAVLSRVELCGWRHRKSPSPSVRCSSYRHLFLLADGSCLSLWELRYAIDGPAGADGTTPAEAVAGPAGAEATAAEGREAEAGCERTLYEVYDSPEALSRSARRVLRVAGDPEPDPAEGDDDADSGAGPYGSDAGAPPSPPGLGLPLPDDVRGPFGAAYPRTGPSGPGGGGPDEAPAARFPESATATGEPYSSYEHRAYASGDSPEHARRLLRRAENPDRPGAGVLRRLAGARGHEILHAPRPPALAREQGVWCSVYEHAFLLADGRELSLYELEHNLSPGGRLVCEVYPDESVAESAARRRAREHGLDL